MTPKQLAAISARAAKATGGPWAVWKKHLSVMAGPLIENTPVVCRGGKGRVAEADGPSKPQAARNAAFIAHARTDVPALIAEVERQGRQIERLLALGEDAAGRLREATVVIMAVREWDDAGGDRAPEASRLLHNAYVEWFHETRRRDDPAAGGRGDGL